MVPQKNCVGCYAKARFRIGKFFGAGNEYHINMNEARLTYMVISLSCLEISIQEDIRSWNTDIKLQYPEHRALLQSRGVIID